MAKNHKYVFRGPRTFRVWADRETALFLAREGVKCPRVPKIGNECDDYPRAKAGQERQPGTKARKARLRADRRRRNEERYPAVDVVDVD